MHGPLPLLVLSMALHRTGKEAEARERLASAMLNHHWGEDQVKGYDDWIRHVLRREAEKTIVPNLAAILDGKEQPQDKYERAALIGVCRFENRLVALARIYDETFAAGLQYTTHMHDAARIACQVGCGRGIDAGGLSEAERSKWRGKARSWLRGALSSNKGGLDRDFDRLHRYVRQELTKWQTEPELASIRDPSELEKLLPDEQADCRKLWAEVKAVVDSTSKAK
jgi:serine/threonine-protein kinase